MASLWILLNITVEKKRMRPSDYNLTKAAYSIDELMDILPLGRTKLYAAAGAGNLKLTKFGKRTMVLAPDVAAFLNSLSKTAA
jgi:hypothetical protein